MNTYTGKVNQISAKTFTIEDAHGNVTFQCPAGVPVLSIGDLVTVIGTDTTLVAVNNQTAGTLTKYEKAYARVLGFHAWLLITVIGFIYPALMALGMPFQWQKLLVWVGCLTVSQTIYFVGNLHALIKNGALDFQLQCAIRQCATYQGPSGEGWKD